jgi:UDP-3-O-[3-hydroxymyristoyl] glucosamine N-acyltransferase
LKLKDIAQRLDCRLEGDGDLEIQAVARIEDAGPSDLTFFANPKYAAELRATRAGAVILGETAEGAPCAMLRCRHPYLAFAQAVELFGDGWRPQPGVHRLAWVGDGVELGPDVSIAAFAVVGDGVRIGARTIVYPHVTIGRDTILGDDCVVHARVSLRERVTIGHRVVIQDGAVVGSDGFGFARRADGSHHKITQIGSVIVEDDV